MNQAKSFNRLYAVVALIILVIFIIAAVAGLKRINAKLSNAETMSSPPLAVKTIEVSRGTVIKTIPALATLKSASTIQIKAESGGTILQLNYREGDPVETGATLAVIDSREQDAQLQAAIARKESANNQVNAMNATLAALTGQVDSLKVNLKYWEDELSRGRKLFQVKALTKSALDNMHNRHAEAQGKLSTLLAQIQAQKAQMSAVQSQQKASEKDVQVWKVRRDYAEVVAPLNCIVSSRLQEEGNRVAPGASLFNVEDVSSTRLLMQIPQESALMIKTGQKILFHNGENSGFVVNRIFPVQNELRQVTVEAAKTGIASGLALDMLISVRIVVEELEGLVIPQEARFVDFVDQSRFHVFLIRDNVAQRISLKPLLSGDDGLVIADSPTLAQPAVLAIGPYLENVRLPASFAVEVVK